MEEVILVKLGELMMKGMNRGMFERALIQNIKKSIEPFGEYSIRKHQGTLQIRAKNENASLTKAEEAVSKVFGIAKYTIAASTEKDLDVAFAVANDYLKDDIAAVKTFKVESKRSDKQFPYNSPQISKKAGAYLLNANEHLSVDVHNPDLTITFEVRDKEIFIRGEQKEGAGGMPVGTAGKAAILISGGIDSPVAAWMMAKRGIALTAIHFASPPYTSKRAQMKVEALLSKVARYSGPIPMLTVPFTKLQEEIRDKTKAPYHTLILRRAMMMASSLLAHQHHCLALITGESVGQVASQTLPALITTDDKADFPVLRPCVGLDKIEIIDIARKINTYETAILPYEDCCSIFTPRHPKTNPKLSEIQHEELNLPLETLVQQALEEVEFKMIHPE